MPRKDVTNADDDPGDDQWSPEADAWTPDEDYVGSDPEGPGEHDTQFTSREPEFVACPHCGKQAMSNVEVCPYCNEWFSGEAWEGQRAGSPPTLPKPWIVIGAIVRLAA